MSSHRIFGVAAVVIMAGSLSLVPRASLAGVPLTVDFNDGYTFSGVQRTLRFRGTAFLPLGNDYALVPSSVELFQTNDAAGHVRALFPGQGGQTLVIESGDPIPFEYKFEGVDVGVRMTSLSSSGYGGGLGNTIEFDSTVDFAGSGEGMANINLANLGFLEQTNFMSLALGNSNGIFTIHDLGVDLNGDGVHDVLNLNNFVGAGSVFTGDAPGFDYSDDPVNSVQFLAWRQGIPQFNGSGAVNPGFGLALDTAQWTLNLDLLVQPVPEPTSAVLAAFGLVALMMAGRWTELSRPQLRSRNSGGRTT